MTFIMWIMEFITVTTVIPNVIILTQNIIKQAIIKPGMFLLLFVCSTVQKCMLLLSKDKLQWSKVTVNIYIDFYFK